MSHPTSKELDHWAAMLGTERLDLWCPNESKEVKETNDQLRERLLNLIKFIPGSYKPDYFEEIETQIENSTTEILNCECGTDKVGSGLHSTWCPKHEEV